MSFLTMMIVTALLTAQSDQKGFDILETSACTFKLSGITLTEIQQKGVVFGIECIQKTYEDTFGFTYPEGFKIKVVLFREEKDFLDYQQRTIGEIITESGYFSPVNTEAVTWLQGGFPKMISVLFHETSHMLMGHQVPWCPNWINEGLAEYFERLDLFNGKRCICINKDMMDWCKYWLKKGFPVEFETFLAMDYESWKQFDDSNDHAGYTIGYSIAYFLMTNSQTQNILKEILWDLKRNGYGANSVETVNRFYPGGVKKLEAHWRNWIPRAPLRKPLRALVEKTREKQETSEKDEP